MAENPNPNRQWLVLLAGIPSIVGLIGIWWSLQDRTVSEGEYRGERTAEVAEYARRLERLEEIVADHGPRIQAIELRAQYRDAENARRLEAVVESVKDLRDEMRRQRRE